MRQAKFDLMLEAWRTSTSWLLTFVYDTELFDRGHGRGAWPRGSACCSPRCPAPPATASPRLPLRTADDDALLLRLSEARAQPAGHRRAGPVRGDRARPRRTRSRSAAGTTR